MKDIINGPTKLDTKNALKNLIQDFSTALKNPGLRGTTWEVLNTQSDEAVRMEAGKSLKNALNNFLIPKVKDAAKTQVQDVVDYMIYNTPKDVSEMMRQRADALTRMDRIQKQISAFDRGWGDDPTLEIAQLQSQYRAEKKNVDALGKRIEQVTANPQLSKYAYTQSFVKSQMR